MIIPLPKLKAILLYFSNKTDRKYLGKVKLMKLIYFLDFLHLKRYGSPVTYDTYVHLQYGPIPQTIKNLIDDAADNAGSLLNDTIAFEKLNTVKGNKMSRVHPKRSFSEEDEKLFSETELEILEKVTERFSDKTTDEIVKASHKEAPWKETEELEQISYTLAAKDKDSKVTEEEIEALLKL